MGLLRMNRWMPLLALSLPACGGLGGEEPLYVLRDSLGRSVAVAGRSQLADAAPGSVVRASIGGPEQELMVGERVGRGPILVARPSAAPEPSAITSIPLEAPPAAQASSESPARATRSARQRGAASRASAAAGG